ncbi:hypothetical protein BU24DRAFT_468146 [Aaosphaeria arxii CBS 175.79]|uniref:Uncharacterized protein n=1 Tax=Aaosphaeria arxii CBS 175.79 TaxID=1450172 RepID=A0A6A5X881_9PLEO|nr:uncharacterized protein BU24DRAFT_468146 [Aaosphaeria arxii CBS 175.79]KAF2009153.1 hypothetical protein BU24DRAFT_468146 [Aaosphaeria arxii CBS 175.79]
MDLIQREIIDAIERSQKREEDSHAAQLTNIKQKLDLLQEEISGRTKELNVIRSLYRQELRRRWEEIPVADQASNEWVFTETTFRDWLESDTEGDNFYCIKGRAGSGKSTLLKFIASNACTKTYLKEWSKPARLCIAEFYFWNQGFELQRSHAGLLQSLLYQILKTAPQLTHDVCPDRLDHEDWSMQELKATFELVGVQTKIPVKFCFFIDGLDEYSGPEEELVEVLKFLSISRNIKICASTRPRTIFDKFFQNQSRNFDIAIFTKADMTRHAQSMLYDTDRFQDMERSDPECGKIISTIADLAQGVWLWVFLVTNELKMAINGYEETQKLVEIVHRFPSNLDAYFKRMLQRVRPPYIQEMSHIFLITTHQRDPLPLYAFFLLEKESLDPNYALNAPIEPINEGEIQAKYQAWSTRIQNRCSDLLVVDSKPHPLFLSHSVNFLHRTVLEFLQDHYEELKANSKHDFSPALSLCKISLAMLKSFHRVSHGDTNSMNHAMSLTLRLLNYAQEAAKNTSSTAIRILVAVLDEADRVNTYHARHFEFHWTSYYRLSSTNDTWPKDGNYNFLALAVESHLVFYVRSKLEEDPSNMNKCRRPLLHYAVHPFPPSRGFIGDEIKFLDVEMVQVLLEHGADPNQTMDFIEDRPTAWVLFLCWLMYVDEPGNVKPFDDTWYHACILFVQPGARRPCVLYHDYPDITVQSILTEVFGSSKAEYLQSLMDVQERKREPSQKHCIVL